MANESSCNCNAPDVMHILIPGKEVNGKPKVAVSRDDNINIIAHGHAAFVCS